VGFNVLAVRSGEDTGDDALHPLLSDASHPELIALDRYDGPNVARTVATDARVFQVNGRGLKQIAKLTDVRIDVYITDGRLAMACQKYDKGGGWVGFGGAGLLIAVTANVVSKARAARRSRGKVLVGHVRYPWLKAVGATSKTGFFTSEAIRLEFAQNLTTGIVHSVLELTLPKNTDATQVAQDLIHRAASYRLAHFPEHDAEARAKFTSLSQAPPRLRPQPGKFAIQQMPNYYFAGHGTAFPASGRPRLSTGHSGAPGQTSAAAPPAAAVPRTKIAEPPRPAAVQSFCTQCGTRREPGDNFCQECGAALEANGDHRPGVISATAETASPAGTAVPQFHKQTASRALAAVPARKLIAMGLVALVVIMVVIVGHAVASSDSIAVGDCVVTNPDVLTEWSIKKVACSSTPATDLTVQKVVSVESGSDGECDLGLTTFHDDPADKTYCLNSYLSAVGG
jgi:hypothetical protein